MKKIKKTIIVLCIIFILLLVLIFTISKNKNKTIPDGIGLTENIVDYNTKPLRNANSFYTVESYVRKIFTSNIRKYYNEE
jgi:uncharacterized membrane protein